MRWFVGVPAGTNPLILRDAGVLLSVLWALSAGAVFLFQVLFTEAQADAAAGWALLYASYLVLTAAASFFAAAFFFLFNRYAVLYRMEETYIYCESMRKPLSGLRSVREFLHWRPFPAEPLLNPGRSAVKTVAWSEVGSVSSIEWMRTFVLQGRRGVLARVYCPDAGIFDKALAFAREAVRDVNSKEAVQ